MIGSKQETLFTHNHVIGVVIQRVIWISEEKTQSTQRSKRHIMFELEKDIKSLFLWNFLQMRTPLCWRVATMVIPSKDQMENYQWRTKGTGLKNTHTWPWLCLWLVARSCCCDCCWERKQSCALSWGNLCAVYTWCWKARGWSTASRVLGRI